jgi:hypothetical protein
MRRLESSIAETTTRNQRCREIRVGCPILTKLEQLVKSPYCTNPQRHYLPLCGSAYRDLLEFYLALYSKNRQVRYCIQRRQAVEGCENHVCQARCGRAS